MKLFLALLATFLLWPGAVEAKRPKSGNPDGLDLHPFVLTGNTLPKGFTGTSATTVNSAFMLISSRTNKDSFETTDEFNRRLADKARLLDPIKTDVDYAVTIEGLPFTYDADSEIYIVGGKVALGGYWCYSSEKPSGWVVCPWGIVYRKKDSYRGTNAYGASVSVERLRLMSFGMAFKEDGNPLLNVVMDWSRLYVDKFPVPIQKAKALKGLTLSTLAVGRFYDLGEILSPSHFQEPTLTDPVDTGIIRMGVPFDLREIIYYVVETGEILARRQFKTPPTTQ
jgi:hypothetical protein